MSTYLWLAIGLAAFDLGLCVLLYGLLRKSPCLNGSILLPVGMGLSGFVFHAFMFFHGAMLILQLATILAIFGIVLAEVRKRRLHTY